VSVGSNYHGVYSVLSTAACGSIAFGFFKHGRSQGPKILNASRPGPRIGALVFQSLGLIGFSQLFPKLQVPVSLVADEEVQGDAPAHSVQNPQPQEPSKSSFFSGQFKPRCPMDFTPADVPAGK
jgi:hypothetical protein